MTTKKKKFLILVITAAFAITVPAVLGYANGWRVDLENLRFVKTGAVFLKADEGNASIFLNEKKYGTTPQIQIFSGRFIQNLIPQDYLMRVEKSGFQPWEKLVVIEPGKTAEFKNIILFPKDALPRTVSPKPSQEFRPELKNGSLYYIATSSSAISALVRFGAGAENPEQFPLPQRVISLRPSSLESVSNDGMTVFFATGDEQPLYQFSLASSGILLQTTKRFSEKESSVTPHPLNPLAAYILTDHTVVFVDGTGLTENLFKPAKVLGLAATRNSVYVLDGISGALQRWDALTHRFEENVGVLGQTEMLDGFIRILIGQNEGELALLNTSDKTLFVLEQTTGVFTKLETHVADAVFSNDGKLIYWQDEDQHNRLWAYYAKTQEEQPYKSKGTIDLIKEFDEPILAATPYPFDGVSAYAFVGTTKRIIGVELDSREPVNAHQLYEGSLRYVWFTQGHVFFETEHSALFDLSLKN